MLQGFLCSCGLPQVTQDYIESLNAPITKDEVEDTLKLLPSGKSSGPDGLTYLYYQTYCAHLSPHLVALYNSLLEVAPIPGNMLHSYVSLIPKPGKDLLDC